MDLLPGPSPSTGSRIYNNTDRLLEDMELFVTYSHVLLRFASICCIVFILIGIPGNLITIIALARCKKVRNATAVFIMNLSCSDLLFCCFNLPLAASTFWNRAWTHGELLCQLFPLLRYGLMAVSLFSVLAITINRYVMIGHPRLYPRIYRRRFLGWFVAFTWICGFGALIATAAGVWGKFGMDPTIWSCSILPDARGQSPKEFLFIVAFLLPCISIIVCYARIFYIVRKTAAKSRMQSNASMKNTTNISSGQTSKLITSITEDNSMQLQSLKTDKSSAYESENAYDHSSVYSTSAPNGILSNNNQGFDKSTVGIVEMQPTNIPDPHLLSPPKENFRVFPEEPENIPIEPSSSSGIETSTYDIENDEEIEEDNMSTRSNTPSLNSTSRNVYQKRKRDRIASGVGQVAAVLRRSTKKTRNIPRRRSTVTTSGSSLSYPGKMSPKDKKLLKMILVIFISFLICYLPITITKIFKEFVNYHILNISGYLLVYLTPCINPIIYVVMSSEYRQAYKNLLICRSYGPDTSRQVAQGCRSASQRA